MNVFLMMKNVLFHPIDYFYEAKGKNGIKIYQPAIIMSLAVIVHLLSLISTGYSFNNRPADEISVFVEINYYIIPWLSWCIVNWAVSSILDGEGRFTDILVNTALVFTPFIVFRLPIALLSNILSVGERSIYYALNWSVNIWCLILLIIQIKIVHNFSIKKTIGSILLTILGIMLGWFILLLFYGLISQAVNFVLGLIKEIGFRS